MIRNARLLLIDKIGKIAATQATTRHPAVDEARVAFGIDAFDGRIGGGLTRAALHEIFAGSVEDNSAAAGFALGIAIRACQPGHPVIWVREDRGVRRTGALHAPGLVELGLDPGYLVLIQVPDTLALLRAGADLVKCGQVCMVILEPYGPALALDLTASRRLAMAAAASGVMTLTVRSGAEPTPSAAQTRWRVATAPSIPLPANAPGYPAFDIALLRHRGGIAGFDMRMEWNRDRRSFSPLSGSISSVPAFGTDQARAFAQARAA